MIRRFRRCQTSPEDGFILMELLVATALALVLCGTVLSLLESSAEVQARDTEWAQTMQEGRAGLGRMAREIRQASKVEEANTNAIVFLATLGGKSLRIKYECNVAQTSSLDRCVRFSAAATESLPTVGATVLSDVINGGEVFSYSPNTSAPTVVTLKVVLPAGGTLKEADGGYTHSVVLEDAAYMRNLYLEG